MDDRFRPDVMLLAAGLGSRMRPLTETTPKPLVPVGGKPMIDRVVDEAVAEGLSRFVVNTHHLSEQVVAHVGALQAKRPDTQFGISREEDGVLGTGGGVKAALALLATDPILIMNTDAFWTPGGDRPIKRMLERFAEGMADIVLLCAHQRTAIGYRHSPDIFLDSSNRITRRAEVPVIYAGAALIARQVFEGSPVGPFELEVLFEAALARDRLYGVMLASPWLHVGDSAAIGEAEAVLEATA